MISILRNASTAGMLAALFVGLVVGWWATSNYYQSLIDERELESAIARANQGKRDYEKLIEAQNSLDAWRRNAVDLDAELRRVQSAAEDRDRKSSSVTCRVDYGAITRCEALLRESAELLAEGGKLLQHHAAVHDGLAEAVK